MNNRTIRRQHLQPVTPAQHAKHIMQVASMSSAVESFTIRPTRADRPSPASCKLVANTTGNTIRLGSLAELTSYAERMPLIVTTDERLQ